MNQISINTSQNVNIIFNTASLGSRIFATIIDILIKMAYSTLFFLVFRGLSPKAVVSYSEWDIFIIFLIGLAPVWLYTLVLEYFMGGQTFGKKIMKIKVVKIDGYQASFGDYLIRWIFCIIDVYTSSAIAGILSIIISKNSQRIGDMVSGTAVISLKNDVTINHTILENIGQDYIPVFPQVIAFSDNDIRIIKENFRRADFNNDQQILYKLVEKIQEILKIEYNSSQFTPRQFISTIIKDYNFYTGKDS